jgi:hypothetical protein
MSNELPSQSISSPLLTTLVSTSGPTACSTSTSGVAYPYDQEEMEEPL